MNPDQISLLLHNLQAVPSTDRVANPYQSPDCAGNLAAYLEALVAHPYSGHLLVGEAFGYRGGALTGIPFTSPRILRTPPHTFLKDLRARLVVSRDISEPTATMVWSYLQTCPTVPACWNVFPFHPHQSRVQASNRVPNAGELEAGRPFLDTLLEILSPHTLIAIGKVAEKALQRWYPQARRLAVRHPSHGGKKAFGAGLTAAGIA
jgi:hypothetical protein